MWKPGPERGFTLIELLVSILISLILLAGFGAFYLAQQQALRHHQAEIELSQELRTALEQMSRDIRSARMDVTRQAAPEIITAETTGVVFELDANDDGDTDDAGEQKGFRLTGADLEQLDATWGQLATNVSPLRFRYFNCCRTELTPPVTSADERNAIASIDVSITLSRPVISGLPITRTEVESVRLRNVSCRDVTCP